MEHLGDQGVDRLTPLWDYRLRVGDLREEVLRVGRVLPVAVDVGDVAVVPVVSRLHYEAPSQEPQGESEEQARRGHCFHSRGKKETGVKMEEKKKIWWMLLELKIDRGPAERESSGDGETQSGCDAHSGLSGHPFTLYKDIRAWHGATPSAAIHQSCGGPSQLHQESPLL